MKKNSKIIIAIIIVSPIFWIFQDLITFNDSKIIENSESEEYTDIIGLFDRKELSNNPHSEWFNQNYSDYNLDQETLNKLKPLFKDIEITVFMGTWCSDSRKEIPVFYKLIDKLNFSEESIELIGMTLEKTTPDSLEFNQNLINVPTFIFKKDGKEINRIVEFPLETIEKDILEILTTKNIISTEEQITLMSYLY